MIKKMNLTNKLHQKFVIDKIKEIEFQKNSKGPLIVELDTTEACDMACPGCISEEMMVAGNKLTSDRLMKLAEELKDVDVKGIVLIGGGEPLAHPAIGTFMDYLGQNDISIGITTNGSFIHKHMNTIAKYSSWTRVSMDAATNNMFSKLRPTKSGGSKFNMIVESMRELAKVKKGKLGFSFLIRTEIEGLNVVSNIDEIYDAALLARDIGCDYFEVKPSYNYQGNSVHSLVQHKAEKMEQAKKEISRLTELVTDDFSIVKAITLDASLEGAQVEQTKKYTSCPATELRTLITPSGVFVCPYWRGKDQFSVGDIMNDSFQDIWASQKRAKIQQWLDPSIHCPFNCLRHDTNLEVFKIIEEIKEGKKVEVVKDFDRFI